VVAAAAGAATSFFSFSPPLTPRVEVAKAPQDMTAAQLQRASIEKKKEAGGFLLLGKNSGSDFRSAGPAHARIEEGQVVRSVRDVSLTDFH